VVLGAFPESLLLGILVVSFLKDVVDEYRLWQGRDPLGYAGIEHSLSNAVLIAFILLDVIQPTGTVLGLSVESVALWLAAIDLVFDRSQDARAEPESISGQNCTDPGVSLPESQPRRTPY
jgi:hypothetical protein